MKTKLIQSTASLTLAFIACGGSAAAAPGDKLPNPEDYMERPEDPVILPTEEEIAQMVKNIREANIRMLKHDADGWDDLEVSLWRSYDEDYKFEPNNKTKDTDGDGMSDYEEMLVNRNPTYKEPIYTKEELVAQVRESRRKAIVAERARLIHADARITLMTPYLPRTVIINGRAQLIAKPQLAQLQERVAATSRAAALPPANELALRAAAARHGMTMEEKSAGGAAVKFSGTYAGMPVSVTSDNYISAQLSNVSQLWPAGQNTITVPTVTPALPALWATGQSGLNLTGAGTRIGLFEVGAVFDGTFTQHEDLGNHLTFPESSRILWQVDSTSASSFHANAVAGVLVGRGARDLTGWLTYAVRNTAANTVVNLPLGRAARGMSYGAQMSAWDRANSITELPTAFGSTHNIRISNHSYGLIAGWLLRDAPLLSRWYGTSTDSEDHKFGFYHPALQGGSSANTPESRGIDEFVASSVFHLPVISAGNERLGAPAGQNGTAVPPVGILHEELNALGQWVQTSVYRTPDGDQGGYDTLRSPGTAKNALTVGSLSVSYGFNGANTFVTLDESSGRGPTDDGRIKPEVVAKGVDAYTADNGTTTQPLKNQFGGGTSQAYQVISGTSFASPSVAGGLNLCAQRYAQLYPLRQALHASSWRALAAHGATNLGAVGPEFRWGYGLFNAAAITILLQADFNSGSDAFLKEAPIFMEAAGQPTDFIEFLVRATGGTTDLKFTIAWTDPAGDVPGTTTPDAVVDVLKNDMGLTIIAPDGTVWRPWILNADATNETQAVREQAATRGVNNTDNLEQVLIPAANVTAGGIYRVRIQREDVMTTALQWISIAGNGITPQPRPPLQVSKLTKGVAANTWLTEWPSIVGRDYQVQISPNLQTWTDVGSAATASKELMSLLVTVPAGNTKYFFRVKETQ